MREIKFRGKAECGIKELEKQGFEHVNGWIYGTYLDGYIVNGVVESTDEYIALEEWCPVKIETVGQYTGLEDKNGKEIYEGDIIQDERGKKYLIKWGINSNGFIAKTNEAHCNVYSSYHLSFKTQVIGNIHDNPELLEAK
jgi:uncharacterized phage protein (TIGR01671 family)